MITNRNYLVHPQYIIITLIIAGITALFLGFTGSYLYTRFEHGGTPIQVPDLFYFNSLWIIASSLTLIYAKKCIRKIRPIDLKSVCGLHSSWRSFFWSCKFLLGIKCKTWTKGLLHLPCHLICIWYQVCTFYTWLQVYLFWDILSMKRIREWKTRSRY